VRWVRQLLRRDTRQRDTTAAEAESPADSDDRCEEAIRRGREAHESVRCTLYGLDASEVAAAREALRDA